MDRETSFSPLGRERVITPVKEDLAAFKAFRHQDLRDLLDGQFLLSARLWNESVTKASSPTVSATASEAPAEAAPEAPAEEAPEAAPEAPAEEAPEAASEAPAEEASEAASEAPAEEAPEAAPEEAPEEARTYPSGEVERGGLTGYELDGEGNFQLKASTAGVSRGSAHPPGKDGRWQRGQLQADDRLGEGEGKVEQGEAALNHAQRQAHAAEGQEIRGA